jgi:hypothetical protein
LKIEMGEGAAGERTDGEIVKWRTLPLGMIGALKTEMISRM